MTRGHNNSRMITMGAQLVGDELAKNIAKGFVNGKYDGGRHQNSGRYVEQNVLILFKKSR